jgi:hypothetical protein
MARSFLKGQICRNGRATLGITPAQGAGRPILKTNPNWQNRGIAITKKS